MVQEEVRVDLEVVENGHGISLEDVGVQVVVVVGHGLEDGDVLVVDIQVDGKVVLVEDVGYFLDVDTIVVRRVVGHFQNLVEVGDIAEHNLLC